MKLTASQKEIAGANAVVFFHFWLMILLAGIDRPPPLRALDCVIWFAIVGIMGVFNSVTLYAVRRAGVPCDLD